MSAPASTSPRRILVTWLVVVLIGLSSAPILLSTLSSSGFYDKTAESSRARDALGGLEAGPADFVVRLSPGSDLDDEPSAVAAGRLAEELREHPAVSDVVSYWETGDPRLRADDASSGLLLVTATGSFDDRMAASGPIEQVVSDVAGADLTGEFAVYSEINRTSKSDLLRAEILALPLMAALLVWFFRGWRGAVFAMLLGLAAMAGGFLALTATRLVWPELSIFSMNLVAALGLGLGVDYALLLVYRLREEGGGTALSVPGMLAVRSTIVASSSTIAVALLALLVFPQPFLRSFAFAGVPTAVVAGLAATTLGPALLSLIRPAEDAGHPRGIAFWRRQSARSFGRPIPALLLGLVVLGVPAAQLASLNLGVVEPEMLGASSTQRQRWADLEGAFSPAATRSFPLVVPVAGTSDEPDISALAALISGEPDVAQVDSVAGSFIAGELAIGPLEVHERFGDDQFTWMNVSPSTSETTGLIESIRAEHPDVLVGGPAAEELDNAEVLARVWPWAAALVLVSQLAILLVSLRSVVLPLVAAALNLLSLAAAGGLAVVVFQRGAGESLLGFTATGSLWFGIPILIACIAIGVSIDYEVFILKRIKELRESGASPSESVIEGIAKTGPLVSAAALVIAVAFGAYVIADLSFMKLWGFALAAAVLLDAWVVRAVMLPGSLRLVGRAAWWYPFGSGARVTVGAPTDGERDDGADPRDSAEVH